MNVALDGLTQREMMIKDREKLFLSVFPYGRMLLPDLSGFVRSVWCKHTYTQARWHEMKISVRTYQSGLILDGFNLAHEFMTVVNTISLTSHTHINKHLFINFDVVRAYCDICRSCLSVNTP